jgi:DNA-binding NarL/FixJ family response regulator
MPPTRILLADDFEPWRRFVVSALEKQPRVRDIVEVSDGLLAVQKAQELQPGLILLDIGLPGLNGIEVARLIQVVVPKAKILFLSENYDRDVAEEALRAGAGGYVVKSDAGRELMTAIKAVMKGKRFVSERLRRTAPYLEFERLQAAD